MLRILLIDDNPDDRILATRSLKQAFPMAEVRSIIDAATLEQALQQDQFDIVITDYQLLWSNGISILERIKALNPSLPVVMFTNSGNEEIVVAAMKLGLDDYLLKSPRHYARLPIVVQSVLQRTQAQRELEAAQAKLLQHERDARNQAEIEKRRSAFLSEASRLLSSSLEFDSVLQQVAQLAVPELADWCIVDIIDGDVINWRDPVVAAIDAEKESLVRELKRKFPPKIDDEYGAAKVLRTGKPELISDASDLFAISIVENANHLTLLHQLEAKSFMFVPIQIAGRTLGTISFVSAQPDRYYTEADLEMAMELARRSAFAIENARLYRESQVANRLKDEFLSIVSHELRTPLNAILGWSKLMQQGNLSDAVQKAAASTIERNAQLQTQLIEDIIDAALIIQNQIRLTRYPLDLIPLIDTTLQTLQATAATKSIQIEAHLDLSVGHVFGDAKRLQQVIGNLLSNAIKFTPNGGRIEVRLEQTKTHAQLQIIDTGRGIHPEFLPHIYDRFRQADSSHSRLYGGLGLGLTISRHLIEMHGGTIYAASEGENRGTTITVQLPLHTLSQPLKAPVIEPVDRSILNGLKVLLVEDDPANLELIQFILSNCGIQVTTATSVHEARTAIAQQVPDLLISDIGMPDTDGCELVSTLRASLPEQGSNVPAIALTAFSDEATCDRIAKSGFQVQVIKPISPAELIAIVAKTAKQSQSTHQPV
jgi:signal transduction histidine kinase/DNA-binding response OmpR family regulator